MPKWIDEKVLQRYWLDRCTIYEANGKKIKSSKFNIPFNHYPDVINRLADDSEIPAEVEWKTSDFDHNIQVLKDSNGFLIVYQKDQNFSLPQVVLDHKDFDNWFKQHSKIILSESLKEYQKESIARKFPKIWLRYNDIKNNENVRKSLEIGFDGFPENTKVLPRLKDVRTNDLVLFLGPYKSTTKGMGGRVPISAFKGYMKRVILLKSTKGYHYDVKPIGWKSKSGEIYPHRFCISKPLLEFENLQLEHLSSATRDALHHLVATGFWEADPTHFVELLSQAKLLHSQLVGTTE